MAVPLVFISGASSGIGQALAAHFAAAGWRLALVARRAGEIEVWCRARGGPAERWEVYGAAVRDMSAITAADRDCLECQGLPAVVIANAGISVGVDTDEARDLEVIRATFETNNFGMAATFQPFLKPMRELRRGTLVGVASAAAIRGLPGHGPIAPARSQS